MRLYFRQRFFSWFDSYDVYDEAGNTIFQVQGQLAWGHCLKIYDAAGNEMGTVREKIFTFLPRFELYIGDEYAGMLQRKFTFFTPQYEIDFNGWQVQGNFMEWDYTVGTGCGCPVATISKELFHLTDTYVLDIEDERDALCVLMLVLAIDAEKCSRKN